MTRSAFTHNEFGQSNLTKPTLRHGIAFDKTTPLSQGLLSLLLFENCTNNGSNTCGMIDYAEPYRKFSYSGTSQEVMTSPYGGGAVMTSGTTNDCINYSPVGPSTNVWTISFFVNFLGTGVADPFSSAFSSDFGPIFNLAALTGSVSIATNVSITAGLTVTIGNGEFTDFSQSAYLLPSLLSFPSIVRLTFTSNGTTTTSYSNGQLVGTAALTGTTFALGSIIVGWPFPTTDFFYWNRCLSAQEVAAHSADPYWSVFKVIRPIRPQSHKTTYQPAFNNGPMMSA